jgi:hypothetical protein
LHPLGVCPCTTRFKILISVWINIHLVLLIADQSASPEYVTLFSKNLSVWIILVGWGYFKLEKWKATNAIARNLKSHVLKHSQVWGVDKFLLTVIWLTTIWIIASFVPDVQYKQKIRKWARAPNISGD